MKKTILHCLLFMLVGGAPPTMARDAVGTVLITGANRGIGLALAEAFNAGGYQVIGTARTPSKADELAKLGVRIEKLDVTKSASVVAFGERLADIKIDILVNNAGVLGQDAGSLEGLDVEDVAWVLDVNTLGPLRVTQALMPNLLASEGKTVVNISSTMGSNTLNTWGCCLGYRASKAALNSMNTTLSIEYAKQGMTFVALHPGYVQTDMNEGKGNITSRQSGLGLFAVIGRLKLEDNGKFYDYQGKPLPW